MTALLSHDKHMTLVTIGYPRVLSEVLPQAGVAYDSLLVNRARWTDLKREGKKSTEVI